METPNTMQPTQPVQPAPQKSGFSVGRVALGFAWPIAGMMLGYLAAGLLLGLLLLIIVPLAPQAAALVEDERNLYSLFILSLIGDIFIFVIVGFSFRNYLFGKAANIKKIAGLDRWPKPSDLGYTLAAFAVYLVILVLTTSVIDQFTHLLPFIDLEQKQDLGFDNPNTTLGLVTVFVTIVVLPPLIEEFIFRGYMFGAIRNQISFWPTTILVSIAFAAVHGQWNVAVDTFILSIFLCLLREKTGSLWACILLHAIKNGLAFSVLFLFPELVPPEIR